MPLPMSKKLGRVLPSRSRPVEEAEEEMEFEEPSEVVLGNTDSGDDLLRQMDIKLESSPPEYVLTSGAIKGVSIRTYDVGGYVLEDVHQFHERVLQTVKWYGDALHQRDLDVHRLATELDRSQTDYINQKFQIELLRGQTGKALVNEDGSYVTQSQLQDDPSVALQVAQAEVIELTRQNEENQNQIKSLDSTLKEFQVYSKDLEERQTLLEQQITDLSNQESTPTNMSANNPIDTSLDDIERQQLQELLAWAADVEVEYTKMEEQVAELTAANEALQVNPEQVLVAPDTEEVEGLRSRVEELVQQVTESQAYSGDLDTYVEGLQAHINELNEYIAQLSTDVDTPETASEVPESEEEPQEEPEPLRASSYAPELPEGVMLPSQQRRHRPSEFAPATPGAPLTSIDPSDLDKYL